jgi:hypothetical protein
MRALGLHVLDAALRANGRAHRVNRGRIKGRGQAHRLGKFGHAVVDHAMQRLAPPVVVGHIEPWNGARLIHQLRHLLIHGHPANQVGRALLGTQSGVQIGRLRSRLRPNRTRNRATRQRRSDPPQSKALHSFLFRVYPFDFIDSATQYCLGGKNVTDHLPDR